MCIRDSSFSVRVAFARRMSPLVVSVAPVSYTHLLSELRAMRCQLREALDKYNVGFWQSETCIMGNDEEIGGGHGFDRTMKTALYVARIIHHDIVYAGAKSWQWWRAVGGDYKDGLIREYTNDDLKDGRVEDSKLMWACLLYTSRCV